VYKADVPAEGMGAELEAVDSGFVTPNALTGSGLVACDSARRFASTDVLVVER
jgi:hypothetical protein